MADAELVNSLKNVKVQEADHRCPHHYCKGTNQLLEHNVEVACEEDAFIHVEEADSQDAPEAAEHVNLRGLQGVINLQFLKKLA
jgi:hypothetical protein